MEDSGASKVDIVRTTNVCWEYGGMHILRDSMHYTWVW